MSSVYTEGFDAGYADALERVRREGGLAGRMSPPEYYWREEFKFDLRDATRGEQEAVRVVWLAQKLDLLGFTECHVELVELLLGHRSWARRYVESGEFEYDEAVASRG